jgi:transposase InsO family protein
MLLTKIKTGLLINPYLSMYTIIPIIQRTFKNSSMNLILTKSEIENVREYLRQQEIINKYHDGKTNHRGINECYLALSHKYYWPKMKDHITKFINECTVCGQVKYDRHPIKQQFRLVPPPSKPFETVHLDIITIQNEKFLSIIDSFSKYAQAYYLRDGTAISIVQALLTFCTHHGIPLTVITDNGTEFTNQLVAEFLRLHRVQHHRVAPHTPNENGIVERFHSTILEHLRVLRINNKNESVINLMPYALLGYNNSIHSFTKCRPIEVITGHFDPRDPFDIDLSTHMLQQYMTNHKTKMTEAYNSIQEHCNESRKQLIDNRNQNREPELEYSPQQQIFVKNPIASRQKLAPRYTHDVVMADLPIHIYTRKKKGPVAKSRLKRVPNSAQLLQDAPDTPTNPATSHNAGDKT